MLMNDKNHPNFTKIQELNEFIHNTKNLKEWKRVQAVKLRLLGLDYKSIEVSLGVSTSFIAQTQRKYLLQGVSGLSLGHQGSRSYLTREQKKEIIKWLQPPERRNISELERHLIEEYDVLFRSKESYYQILRNANLIWQKGNKENPRKNPARIKERNKELAAILRDSLDKIKAEKLVVYALDECHLQGDEICGYLWGDKKNEKLLRLIIIELDKLTMVL